MNTTEEEICGFILVSKPAGITSHDAVDYLRRVTGTRKIGHAGTLDPMAEGLLIMAVGRKATRRIGYFVKMDKVYSAIIRCGAVSDTYDKMGIIEEKTAATKPSEKSIADAIKKFTGQQAQIPPMYSAKKVGGKKLYELARKGVEVERRPSSIVIHSIKLIKYGWPQIELTVHCSSGTYIRSLAHDMGGFLSCGAYLENLTRTSIGKFSLENAIALDKLNGENWKKYLLASDFFECAE